MNNSNLVKENYKFFKENLNKQQYEAAIYTDTTSLIIAGAGSGKTRVLTFKMLNLFLNKDINIGNVLAVTFTNKAANEMKERLVNLYNNYYNNYEEKSIVNSTDNSMDDIINGVKEEEKQKNISKNDVKIGTFHSICNKLLRRYISDYNKNYSNRFTICDTKDSIGIIKMVMKDLGFSIKDFPVKDIKELISKLKSNAILPSETISYFQEKNLPFANEDVFYKIYKAYNEELEKSNTLDFDDLLLFVYFLLKDNKEIREVLQKEYKYILVDEAQDSNWIQFKIIELLAGSDGNVTFIGDDYQSIYKWRGSLMKYFLKLNENYSNLKIFKLETNYRSSANIVQAGKDLIKNNKEQYDKDLKSSKENGEEIKLLVNPNGYKEANNIISIIKSLKEKKGYEWKDFGILYRINALSAGFEKILLENRIPYKIWGSFRFFERQEIKDILAYMKYIVNKDDNISLSRIINTPSRKIGKTTLEKMRKSGIEFNLTLADMLDNISALPLKLSKNAITNILKFNSTTNKLRDLIDNDNPISLIEKILKKYNYEDYLITTFGNEEAEERLDNIGQLMNMGKDYGNGLEEISRFLNELSLLIDFEDNIDGEENAVKLMTVHSSKGLEFPVVFIIGVEEGIFPGNKTMLEKESLEEERRLMYVAITRAKDLLFISFTGQRMFYGKTEITDASRFINELDKKYIKEYYL